MKPSAPLLACALLFTAAPALRAQSLQDSIRAQLDSLDAHTTLYAEHLGGGGQTIAIRADEPMNSVSVIKIPVMVLAFRDAEAGRLDLDARYTIRPEDLRRGTGLLQTFAVGLQPTYRDLITQMIITSDNTATDIMIHKVGLERVNRMLDSLGYRQTRLRQTVGDLFKAVWVQADPSHASMTDREVYEKGFPNDSAADRRDFAFVADSTKWLGRTTAREMSRLLTQIYKGELASPEHSQEMIRILRRQFYTSRLPQRVRYEGVGVAHKTGDWPPITGNDVGILFYPGGPTVVSVFANENRGSFFDVEATMGRIAEELVRAWR